MNEEKRKQIAELAAKSFEAQRIVENMRMMNCATTYDKAKQQAIDYALAIAEAEEAKRALEDAQKAAP